MQRLIFLTISVIILTLAVPLGVALACEPANMNEVNTTVSSDLLLDVQADSLTPGKTTGAVPQVTDATIVEANPVVCRTYDDTICFNLPARSQD